MLKSVDSKRRLLELMREKRVRRALTEPYYWLTECTKTQDEQDLVNPFKPFPKRPYFEPILEVLQHEAVVFLEKSRTMMASWLVSGHCAHLGFSRPAVGCVFQSRDEGRAVHDIDNIKCLWLNTDPDIRERWPLLKPLEKQAYNRLEMANGSWFLGIPGDPDKIRSEHPTVVVLDEAAFIPDGDASYNTARATRCLQIIALSSAEVGWFEDFTKPATPVDWPEYAPDAPGALKPLAEAA
jgi:hypothetical protein